jgi:hypothetical protein
MSIVGASVCASVCASVGEILREGDAESVGVGVGLLETVGTCTTLMEGDSVLDLFEDLFDEAFVKVDEAEAADTVYTTCKVLDLEDADLLLIDEMDDALDDALERGAALTVGLALMEGEFVGCSLRVGSNDFDGTSLGLIEGVGVGSLLLEGACVLPLRDLIEISEKLTLLMLKFLLKSWSLATSRFFFFLFCFTVITLLFISFKSRSSDFDDAWFDAAVVGHNSSDAVNSFNNISFIIAVSLFSNVVCKCQFDGDGYTFSSLLMRMMGKDSQFDEKGPFVTVERIIS